MQRRLHVHRWETGMNLTLHNPLLTEPLSGSVTHQSSSVNSCQYHGCVEDGREIIHQERRYVMVLGGVADPQAYLARAQPWGKKHFQPLYQLEEASRHGSRLLVKYLQKD